MIRWFKTHRFLRIFCDQLINAPHIARHRWLLHVSSIWHWSGVNHIIWIDGLWFIVIKIAKSQISLTKWRVNIAWRYSIDPDWMVAWNGSMVQLFVIWFSGSLTELNRQRPRHCTEPAFGRRIDRTLRWASEVIAARHIDQCLSTFGLIHFLAIFY